MNIIFSKIDFDGKVGDFASINAWEAVSGMTPAVFHVGVVYPSSVRFDFFNDFNNDVLTRIPRKDLMNFLLVTSSGYPIAWNFEGEASFASGDFSWMLNVEELNSSAYRKTVYKFLKQHAPNNAKEISADQTRVFLSHASEDKINVILPLINALQTSDIDFWVDSVAIKLGDSITQKINEGLRISEYFVIVLSKSFIGKSWPEKELNSILSMNIDTNHNRIIPVIVGAEEDRKMIRNAYPLLHDIYYFSWKDNPDQFIRLFKERLNRDLDTSSS